MGAGDGLLTRRKWVMKILSWLVTLVRGGGRVIDYLNSGSSGLPCYGLVGYSLDSLG